MNWHDAFELASYIVTVIGLPFAIGIFFYEQRKERENEEEEQYQHLSDAYNDFLKIVLDHADLQLRTHEPLPNATPEQRERMLVIFDMLISLFERAYLVAYKDSMDATERRRWNSWDDYMREWCRRDDFFNALPLLLRGEDPAFPVLYQACGAGGARQHVYSFRLTLCKEPAMSADPIVIVSAARTPIGGLLGDFSSLAAWELGAVAIKAAVERAKVPGDAIDEVLMGNCLMAGQGQAPARQAMRKAGLPDSAGAVTLSKMCGSGMRAMMFAHDMLAAGSANAVLAGGMESMTNAPHLMFARKGIKYGAAALYDHMAIDGLEDAYERGKAMGVFAEQCVGKYSFSREAMDQFAIASTQRSKAANEDGSFAWEMAPVTLASPKGDTVIKFDEQPFKAKLDKIPTLKPAFKKDGAITAATSSSISDGAAALVLMRESTAKKMGVDADRAHRRPRRARAGARVVRHGAGRRHPEGAAAVGLGRQEREPVGSQRSLRRGDDGGDGRVQAAARDRQRAWRRGRARPSDRRLRRAHRRHAARRTQEEGAEARRRGAVHRRRRGHRDGR